MTLTLQTTLDELVRASALLSREIEFKPLISVLVEQAIDITHSEVAGLYLYSNHEQQVSDLHIMYKRGRMEIPDSISKKSELVDFIVECREAVIILNRQNGPFDDIFLNDQMKSGIALPLITPKLNIGVLFLNSKKPNYYNRERFNFLNSFTKLASGMLHNSRMYRELKEYVRHVEGLERYQDNIFTSMTNMLITTDEEGKIHYFNQQAADTLGLTEEDVGVKFLTLYKKSFGKKVSTALENTEKTGLESIGIEGIFKIPNKNESIDFSLNISPLMGKRGKREGLTLIFTDQTKERELKKSIKVATEDRRVIKDMFSRYLSNDIVQSLVESPELVKPGGGSKMSTLFFSDIRGYTSFSEDKSPKYIIEVLNEYFSEAVEIIIRYGGYIDKFIGDCIMAAWGVPLEKDDDSIRAVSCAVEIQKLVQSAKRSFFQGKASSLKIGFGMHTGPLVAGNLGSSRRMDYTVIGDTVNLAARLEGVSAAGEIIISEDTKKNIDDRFILEKRDPVKVKGKAKPIEIYNVVGLKK